MSCSGNRMSADLSKKFSWLGRHRTPWHFLAMFLGAGHPISGVENSSTAKETLYAENQGVVRMRS
jgi:hypothetical protein